MTVPWKWRAALPILLGVCAAGAVCWLPARAADLPRLSARGAGLVDGKGRKAVLRGVNLGGWFVEEMWMTPWATEPPAGSGFGKVEDHETLWDTLSKRFGAAGARTLRDVWRDTWITPDDFRRIRAAGFNHVRLPFLAGLVDEPGGMERLRRAVRDANAAGLYVVLDMHGAPGGQNAWHHSGREGRNRFFQDPENIAKGARDWAAVARVFGGNPGVAAFDLMNEPAGAPDAGTLYRVTDRLYRAARDAAPRTLIIIEDGYKGFETLPNPAKFGWKNVMYSTHVYDFDAKKPEDHAAALKAHLPAALKIRDDRGVPVYIGEFSVEPHSTPEGLAAFLDVLNDNGFSWADWTWKTVARGGRMGFWGYCSNTAPVTMDTFQDSLPTLLAKMKQVRTENLSVPPGLAAVYAAATREGTAGRGGAAGRAEHQPARGRLGYSTPRAQKEEPA